MSKITKRFFYSIYTLLVFFIILGGMSLVFFIHLIQDIPDYRELSEYKPSGITRLYDNNGQILDEYANERRIYIRYKNIPKMIINAFIAVEDKNFFQHHGVDIIGIIRASVQNILNVGTDKRLVGASTITQQVVKSFFLNNEMSLLRKLKEAVLAFRVNKAFSKEKLLEIYLNQIYLGNHSYGIYVAAQNYFGKDLNDINIEEAALLASLPKAPSKLNPYRNYNRVLKRRNWAIQRMEEEGFISLEESENAINSKIKLNNSLVKSNRQEDYYTNTVKAELINLFGVDNVYNKTYVVNTYMDLRLEDKAQAALKRGLRMLDKKKGWRGVFAKIDLNNKNISEVLNKIAHNSYHENYHLGVITKVNNATLKVSLANRKKITLDKGGYDWILKNSRNHQLKKLFKVGDVILIDKVENEKYKIEQIPEINGAIVVIENKTGKVLALIGGYDFKQSNFNRVTQAYRQPGSAFKTFVYLLAFEQGVTPNTLILDEPLEIDLGYGLPMWNPKNYGDKYYGLITLRTAFEKSRNLPVLRLLLGIGLDKLTEIAQRYGIYDSNIKPTYSMGLGAFETTLLKITNAYASIANNGILKQPKLIDSVYNRDGKLVYSPNDLFCDDCNIENKEVEESIPYSIPQIGFLGKVMTDSASNYQTLSLLEGVIARGSGRRARVLQRTIAGKTGTTNNSMDTWFIGMTSDITIGLFVGYDVPSDMGENATGASVALPIFVDFFKNLNFIPNCPFQVPDSIQKIYVEQETGKIVDENALIKSKVYIHENFKKDSELALIPNTASKLTDKNYSVD